MAIGSLPLSKTPGQHALNARKSLNPFYAINSQAQEAFSLIRLKRTEGSQTITASLHKFHNQSQPPTEEHPHAGGAS